MKLRLNQKGFSALEIALAVIVMGLVGGTGAYVYQTNKSAAPAETAAHNDGGVQQPPETGTKQYLTITEWGVKIPLSDGDAGAYYKVNTDGQLESESNMSVYAKESDVIIGPAGLSCKGEYIAFLVRLKSDSPLWSKTGEQDEANLGLFTERKAIGAYTYAIATKKQYGPECFNKDDNMASSYDADAATALKFDNVVQAFVGDFTGITAAQ